jgi:molybdate transport system substrate-binding protein
MSGILRLRRLFARLCLVTVTATAFLGCGGAGSTQGADEPLRVSAAASLRDLVTDLALDFEMRQGRDVELNFAGSNVLAQQIRATPQADVYLSADEVWVEDLLGSNKLVPGSVRSIFANRLVVIARPDAHLELGDLSALAQDVVQGRSLVLADPEAVPAGRYARAYLEAEGLWDEVKPQVVPALDVRSALALVETDPSLVGIVYRTDAAVSKRVVRLLELPPRKGIDIVYWGALVKKESAKAEAAGFLEFLTTPEALAIAERHGFLPPTSPAS